MTTHCITPDHTNAAPSHDVQFYDSQPFLFEAVASYLGTGLQRSEGLVVIASSVHWTAMRARLAGLGAPLDEATQGGQIVVLDAARMLDCIQVGGALDEGAFNGMAEASFDMILSHAPRAPVRAYGELVDLLWRRGEARRALAIEQLWNDLLARRPASLLCAYRTRGSGNEDRSPICAAHAHVGPDESPGIRPARESRS